MFLLSSLTLGTSPEFALGGSGSLKFGREAFNNDHNLGESATNLNMKMVSPLINKIYIMCKYIYASDY